MNEQECIYDKINDYKIAFKCFEARFLKDKKSIFRLDCGDEILNQKSIDYLKEHFINNGYIGDGGKKENQTNSIEKFHHQLTGKNLGEDISNLDQVTKDAIEVLATAVWLWRLPASNTNGDRRKKSVQEILNFNPEWKYTIAGSDKSNYEYLEDNKYFGNYHGFAMPGIGYNTNKANELAYIINFFEKFINDKFEKDAQITYLKDCKTVTITTTQIYIKEIEKDKKLTYKLSKIKGESKQSEETVSIYNPLLHLIDNKNYEPIISNNHKSEIVKVFSILFKEELQKSKKFDENDTDKKINIIKKQLKEINKEYHFYHKSVKNIWLGGLDFDSKNIILHGAPGTGKTYITEETIKARKAIEKNSEYELVQFHPSYGYEDFIEGIKPTGIDNNGQMSFELKNGLFKQMCIDAFKELLTNPENPKKYYFIADEINRAELSRVFGELLLCLEDDKRLRINVDKKGNYLVSGVKIQTPNSSLWTSEHAVVLMDNKNQAIKPNENGDYEEKEESKDYKKYFGVPENLYFIGTMNDIDKSVDSFDMALRRRFVWKHCPCDYDVVANNYDKLEEELVEKYIEICKNINNHIVGSNGFNLGSSYELGHSYFMKPKKLNQPNLDIVWKENIAPLLKEYLRAIESNENEIEKLIKDTKKIFKI